MKPPRHGGRADVAPILKAIVRTAARLCDASYAHLHLVDGARLSIAAKHGRLPRTLSIGESLPLTRGSVAGRAVVERRTVHVRDLKVAAKSQYRDAAALQRAAGLRTMLATPLVEDGRAVGALVVLRTTVRPFTSHQIDLLKTFAEQAAIALENARLSRELEARNSELSEALEQQTATGEILSVISSSPTDIQPVLGAVVASAARFCGAYDASIGLREGNGLRVVAHHGPIPAPVIAIPIVQGSVGGRSVLERRPVHVADLQTETEEFPEGSDFARSVGHRATLSVPLLREGEVRGVILLRRLEPEPFTDRQIALLQTFADQAVIAIENVRLFTELGSRNRDLTEALEQQTATADILGVISSSPTDVQPVLDAVAENSARLCGALFSSVYLFDGELIDMRAQFNYPALALERSRQFFPTPPHRQVFTGRAILDRAVVHVPDVQADPEFAGQDFASEVGFRSVLSVPMLREGHPIGAITVWHAEVGPFTDRQIALLQTFADQAVIAIENVRLFTELGARNRDLTEALEQQTATSEILRVINGSQTNTQPVFDTIVRSAMKLCDGLFSALFQYDGELIHQVAQHNFTPEALEEVRRVYPARPSRAHGSARAILEGAIVHIPDVELDPDYLHKGMSRAVGLRSGLYVPMMREGTPVGVIMVARATPGRFSDSEVELLKTFADQAVIAIENVRLFTELEARNHDLSESLEQQTATSEILRVISSSPTDLQPVFDIIAESAVKLCGAEVGLVTRLEGEWVEVKAVYGTSAAGLDAIRRVYPMRPSGAAAGARAIRDCVIAHIPDVMAERGYSVQEAAVVAGFRATLGVPMVREGRAIGSIAIGRAEAGEFSERQIKLLGTFADQAVIAIENVRLFAELEARNHDLTESLEQQTATSEILRVISSSPTDLQPVFDIIAESAAKLCGAEVSVVTRFDGEWVDLKATYGSSSAGTDALRRAFPMRATGVAAAVRAIRDRAITHIPDVLVDEEYGIQEAAVAGGFRAALAVPMIRDGRAIGSVGIGRSEAGEFSERQIKLLRTFADQAMIAIENVRLFTELGARNHDLTEALEQQTATSEILRVISQSPTDVQPVFDTIASSAVRLCDALYSGVYQSDGDLIRMVAHHQIPPRALEEFSLVYPMRLSEASGPVGRAIQSGSTLHIPDALNDPAMPPYVVRIAQVLGYRSQLVVPMIRQGTCIGAISIVRTEVRPFSNAIIPLIQTFADQAVIAIENARLFKELQARTSELTRSVSQLTALGEISQAVSSTLDVETVLQTIVSRASQLAGADGCAIYEYDGATEAFHIRATHNLDPVLVGTLRASPLRKGEGTMGRATETREPIQVADIAAPGAYQSHVRDTLLGAGYRALLSVPLLREGEIIGSLSLNRHAPGEFPPEAVEVLKTFATQSALAIQNARLFWEIADKSRQLEAASRHKSEFLANMSHELRTPLNAIIGFSEVLNERMFGELNDKQAEYLKDIHASGTHLLSLINDILDLSKVEAGRMELELSDFSLPSAIDSALTLVRERAMRRGITLRAAIHHGIGEISGDERKIRQVLLNLLSNAIKFTPEGGRIEVQAVPEAGAVDVSISDTGVGIAPEEQEAAFEEFRQVGASAAKQEGTGLGLALCRKFVELHGGKIWVTSALGSGSTFTFRLPTTPA